MGEEERIVERGEYERTAAGVVLNVRSLSLVLLPVGRAVSFYRIKLKGPERLKGTAGLNWEITVSEAA